MGGILARQIYRDDFHLNGAEISFGATLLAIASYIVVSLLTCRDDYNMDRLLHRRKYAALTEPLGEAGEEKPKRRLTWGRLIGIDEHFSLGDKWIAGSLFGYSVVLFVLFLIGTIWNLLAPGPLAWWSTFWHVVGVGLPVLICVVTGIWFTWGGMRDIGALFRRLREQRVNRLDDGTVVGHRNLDEVGLGDIKPPGNC